MGGLVRLPVIQRYILIFSNIVSNKGRKNGHIWTNFDAGKTWHVRRQVFDGKFAHSAHSALTAGRTGTPSEGNILLFEGAPKGTGTSARFNRSWVLKGEFQPEMAKHPIGSTHDFPTKKQNILKHSGFTG